MTLMSKLRGAPPEDEVESVARNLEAILNSRRGYAGAAPVFGMGDHEIYEEVKPLLDAFTTEMAAQVKAFEPRLTSPTARYDGREGSMWARFEISGKLRDKPQSYRVLVHVVLRNAQVSAIREEPKP
ncbi:type VI secretion system baseplate subunit TssE [Polyangium aurulentum]|uniref:type VI secretion system baseplate subunit TssE n=1 Tax=Polyangium aurulentum TaxID=2567896 RepID=UPI0010AE11D9|nr:type VI secretion system baseplate subunit TssE [Polyangium aurulentum]UQA56295.1 type VI secretion system baseplate subunit TssE [Polyangium aurulentum]